MNWPDDASEEIKTQKLITLFNRAITQGAARPARSIRLTWRGPDGVCAKAWARPAQVECEMVETADEDLTVHNVHEPARPAQHLHTKGWLPGDGKAEATVRVAQIRADSAEQSGAYQLMSLMVREVIAAERQRTDQIIAFIKHTEETTGRAARADADVLIERLRNEITQKDDSSALERLADLVFPIAAPLIAERFAGKTLTNATDEELALEYLAREKRKAEGSGK